MAITGKVIGGVLGSFLGLWGMAIGIGIGHQFDKAGDRAQTAKMALQIAFFGCLAKMARADGTVTKEEIQAIEKIIAQLGYTPQMRQGAIAIFHQAKDDQYSAADYLNQLAAIIHYNHEIGLTFLGALHAVALADGVLHPNEKEILIQAQRSFRLSDSIMDAALGKLEGVDEAYKVLECTPSMSDQEIKKAYRDKCLQYHPDKLASKGLPDEFMKFANEQLAKINDAYETLKKARN